MAQKNITLGLVAHVDSGKTTLSEALLYGTGTIRKLGRVDHKDAFLDTDALEKARGITIFSKQALFTAGNTDFTLLDTPGHVDFSTETERTLQVLDYAVLVISGTDGVQSHTETLWRLLRRYRIPTFVFVNKMDLPGPGREALLTQLNRRLGDGFVDFGAEQADRDEALALCDERLMETMLDRGSLTDPDLIPAIARRHVFPCWFGSALKLQGVDALVEGLDRMASDQISMFDDKDNITFQYFGLKDAVVMGPKPQLIRVFVNLLTNAVQAIENQQTEDMEAGREPKHGQIILSVRNSSKEGFYDIVVEDNGPGIKDENRNRLFTPNFTTKSSGTGLGLAICRNILERCGGEISYSKSFSIQGACFTVRFPKNLAKS